ncbi:MAG: transposase [Cellvibrionaceae bacterium]|nr:transposase [Cellvibrionaceae bacterium]
MKKRVFSQEFKRESASLVVDKGYSTSEACQAVGVSDSAMRKWVKQLKEERGGQTPTGSKALTPEHQRIQELEAKIKRIERENEIIKKATALLMSDTLKSL